MFDVPGITTHKALIFEINIGTQNAEKIKVRSKFNNRDEELTAIRNIPFNYRSVNLHEKVLSFQSNLISVINISRPYREITIQEKRKEWFNESVLVVIKSRDRAYKKFQLTNEEDDWQAYKIERNKASRVIENEKRRYYESKVDAVKYDSVEMWKTLKKMLEVVINMIISNLKGSS